MKHIQHYKAVLKLAEKANPQTIAEIIAITTLSINLLSNFVCESRFFYRLLEKNVFDTSFT